MPTILITGASGFIGGHVVREAARTGAELSLMTHVRRPPSVSVPGARHIRADLAEPGTLHGVCDGADVLIHCAARIGGSAEANEAVNARGTQALVAEAGRAGVRRIVQLSTASVYGRGTFRGSLPAELERNPGSVTSRTRAVAENAVLSAGGVVLRPHLVYGEGDCWVGAGLARILRVLPGTVAGWTSLMSMISAPDLARLLVSVALAPGSALSASVYHATHPEPVGTVSALRAVADCAGIPWPSEDLTVERAREILTENGMPASGLDLLTTDHVFDGTALWSDLGQSPGDGFHSGFRRAAHWYRTTLPSV
ncbi:NAD-dependent epimerase/dehydratase family protein [Streptomyces sp. NPDC047022]|uniref:NAD-dependent epimerase/dehydratase family protein n=1 Tax=Streptomyces sp. NPDC047022 TaxID=3155737 RepID=UPI003407A10D